MGYYYSLCFVSPKTVVPDAGLFAKILKAYDLTNYKGDGEVGDYIDCTYDDLLGRYFGWDDPKEIRKEFMSSGPSGICRVLSHCFQMPQSVSPFGFDIDFIPFSEGTIVHFYARHREFSVLSEYLTKTGRRLVDLLHDVMLGCGSVFALGYGEGSGTQISDVVELYLGRTTLDRFQSSESGFSICAGLGKYDVLRLSENCAVQFPTMKIYSGLC